MYKDYLLRVPKPMDFGTIRGRLDAGLYTLNTDAFTTDMRQVFENAFIYNPPGSDVHSMALTLKVPPCSIISPELKPAASHAPKAAMF